MSDKKTDKKEMATDVLMADTMLRLTALEKVLIDKGLATLEELNAASEEIAKRVAKVVIEKAQAAKNIDEFIADLEGNNPKKDLKN